MGLLSRSRRTLATEARGEAILGSAERISPTKSEKYRRLSQAWQREAFAVYNTLGECWYPAQFYAKALSKLRIYAGTSNDQGEVIESKPDSWAAQQLSRIQDPGGGTEQLFFSYGRLYFLIGEAYLLGQYDDDNDEVEESWEFLSSSELRAVPGTKRFARYEFPGAMPEEIADAPEDDFDPLPDFAVVYRFHNPHPEYSALADSPIRSVLPLYQQIGLLEATFSARLKSRLAGSGILLVDDQLSFGPADGTNQDDTKTDPVAKMLQDAMLRPIREPNSAGAVAPIVMRVPGHAIAEGSVMAHIQIHKPDEAIPELEQWEKAIQRLAVGLDMPPEILLGMTDANHWTAWQVDDQTWTAHLQPIAESLCNNLGSAYLRPLARKERQPDADKIVVGYDASAIINHPDRAQDAKDLHDRLVLSDETLREVCGFTDDDAPTREEMERGLLIKLRGQAAALELQDVGSPTETTTTGGPSSAPNPELAQAQTQDELSQMAAAAKVIGACEMAVERARERAGSRIVSSLQRANSGCDECKERSAGKPSTLVASAVGAEGASRLGFTGGALAEGTADSLRPVLLRQGLPFSVAGRVATLIEAHAARSMWDEDAELPDGIVAFVETSMKLRAA